MAFADAERGDDGRARRKRSPADDKQLQDNKTITKEIKDTEDPFATEVKNIRECPVPKPGGTIGQMLGFKKDGDK